MTDTQTSWPSSTRVPNLAYFLTRNARRFPDDIAIVWEERRWTWAEFDARVSALAFVLTEDCGLAKGDKVLVQSANNNQMLEIMMAAYRAGLVWTPANFRQSPAEVAYLAEKSGARVLILEAVFAEHAAACAPLVERAVAIGGMAGALDYEEALARHLGRRFADVEVDRDHPCWLFFTSGSTGRPKAVVLTHGQMNFTTLNHINDLMPGLDASHASLVVAPLSHGAGMHQLTQIAMGAKTVLTPPGRLDPAEAWRLVEEWKITNMFTVPTIVKMLVEHPAVDGHDHSSLQFVIYAGAPMYRADQVRALETLGNVLVQYYGLGEVTGAITVLRRGDHAVEDAGTRPGSCGVERTGIQVTIQDEAGNILAPMESGEICVIGSAVCAGYLDDAAANAKSFRNGWFRTGDLGHMDAQGFLYITGRASDMYISGGSNVYPREIEEVLLTHPSVSEVAIIGIPDPRWGEVGLCVVVTEGGQDVDEGALHDHLAGRIAKYKMPAHYVFLPEMPKTAYGKITKKLVREELDRLGLIPDRTALAGAPG